MTCALVAATVIATAATGCGGSEQDSTAGQQSGGEQATPSKAAEPPRAFAEQFADLLGTAKTKRDCRQLEAINQRSLIRLPCPPDKAFGDSMKRFEVVGAAEYGTGAVVDYTSGDSPNGAAIVLFVTPDRNWAISRFGVITEPSTDTSDNVSRREFRKAVRNYLAAVRTRNCRAYAVAAFTGDDSTAETCRTTFQDTAGLARRMRANPNATPVYEGGNATYGFFSFEMAKPSPETFTISVIEATPGAAQPYVVLDVAP